MSTPRSQTRPPQARQSDDTPEPAVTVIKMPTGHVWTIRRGRAITLTIKTRSGREVYMAPTAFADEIAAAFLGRRKAMDIGLLYRTHRGNFISQRQKTGEDAVLTVQVERPGEFEEDEGD